MLDKNSFFWVFGLYTITLDIDFRDYVGNVFFRSYKGLRVMTMDANSVQLSPDMIKALDWVPSITWVSDSSGQCLLVNRAWREYTGRSLEESYGGGWLGVMHPEDASTLPGQIKSAYADKSTFTIEARFRRRDGRYRWLQNVGQPLIDESSGATLGYIGCCTDVTNHRQAEEGLRQASAKYRSVLASLKDAVVVIEDHLRSDDPSQNLRRDDRLTPRQREILHLIARGYSTREIGVQLHVSVKTVESHRAQLMQRLNIHDVAGLTRFAIRTGLVQSD
jgi:PAS domain S-box-containing protein